MTFNSDDLTFCLNVIEPQPTILPGDVNSDGSIDIADVTSLIDYILTASIDDFNELNADVDQDGHISIADVTILIDMILIG